MCFDAVIEFPEKMNHMLAFIVGQLDARRPRDVCSEC